MVNFKRFVRLSARFIQDVDKDIFWVNKVIMPIGVGFDKIRAWKTGRDNEKHEDKYESFFLTAVALLNPHTFPAEQLRRLATDEHFQSGPLYLATIVENMSGECLKQRQVFINEQTLAKLNVGVPTAYCALGNGKSLLTDDAIDWVTKGQYWGWARPRVQRITMKTTAEELLSDVKRKLKDPKTKIFLSPLPFFATPLEAMSVVFVSTPFLKVLSALYQNKGPTL